MGAVRAKLESSVSVAIAFVPHSHPMELVRPSTYEQLQDDAPPPSSPDTSSHLVRGPWHALSVMFYLDAVSRQRDVRVRMARQAKRVPADEAGSVVWAQRHDK